MGNKLENKLIWDYIKAKVNYQGINFHHRADLFHKELKTISIKKSYIQYCEGMTSYYKRLIDNKKIW